MMGLFEKSFDFGLGLLTLSREKVEAFVEDLVNKGEIEKKEASQFASNLIKKGEEQKGELRQWIHDEVAKALAKLDIARKDDTLTAEQIRQLIREEVAAALKDRPADQESRPE